MSGLAHVLLNNGVASNLEHLTVYSDSFGFDSSMLCEEGFKDTIHSFFLTCQPCRHQISEVCWKETRARAEESYILFQSGKL